MSRTQRNTWKLVPAARLVRNPFRSGSRRRSIRFRPQHHRGIRIYRQRGLSCELSYLFRYPSSTTVIADSTQHDGARHILGVTRLIYEMGLTSKARHLLEYCRWLYGPGHSCECHSMGHTCEWTLTPSSRPLYQASENAWVMHQGHRFPSHIPVCLRNAGSEDCRKVD